MALDLVGCLSYCRECIKQRMRNVGTVVSGNVKGDNEGSAEVISNQI